MQVIESKLTKLDPNSVKPKIHKQENTNLTLKIPSVESLDNYKNEENDIQNPQYNPENVPTPSSGDQQCKVQKVLLKEFDQIEKVNSSIKPIQNFKKEEGNNTQENTKDLKETTQINYSNQYNTNLKDSKTVLDSKTLSPMDRIKQKLESRKLKKLENSLSQGNSPAPSFIYKKISDKEEKDILDPKLKSEKNEKVLDSKILEKFQNTKNIEKADIKNKDISKEIKYDKKIQDLEYQKTKKLIESLYSKNKVNNNEPYQRNSRDSNTNNEIFSKGVIYKGNYYKRANPLYNKKSKNPNYSKNESYVNIISELKYNNMSRTKAWNDFVRDSKFQIRLADKIKSQFKNVSYHGLKVRFKRNFESKFKNLIFRTENYTYRS